MENQARILRPTPPYPHPVDRSITLRSRAVLLALATVLAFPAAPSAAAIAPAANPRECSQTFLVEGDAAVERGDLDEATAKYREAYHCLSMVDRASYMGSIPVRKAMAVFDQRVAQATDPQLRRQLLHDQRALLAELLLAVQARDAEALGDDVLAELEATRRRLDDALATEEQDPIDDRDDESTTATTATTATTRGPSLNGTQDAPPKPRLDRLGLGLTIGGSALLATGLGVSVGFWTVRSQAQANVDGGNPAFAEGTQARADYLAHTDAIARDYLIAGSVLAGVGLATAAAGVAMLVVRRRADRSTTALRVTPVSTPTTAGLSLHGRWAPTGR